MRVRRSGHALRRRYADVDDRTRRINELEEAIHTPIDAESREVLAKLTSDDVYVLAHTIRKAYRAGLKAGRPS